MFLAVASYAAGDSNAETVPRSFGTDVDPHDKLGIRTAFEAYVRLTDEIAAEKRADRLVVLGPDETGEIGQLFEIDAEQRAERLFNPTENQARTCILFTTGIRLRLRVASFAVGIDSGAADLYPLAMAMKLTDSLARMCRLIHVNKLEVTLTDHQKILVSKLLSGASVGTDVVKAVLKLTDQEIEKEENYVAQSLEERLLHECETEQGKKMAIFMTVRKAGECFIVPRRADELIAGRLTYEKGRNFDKDNILYDSKFFLGIIETRRKGKLPTFITPDEDVVRYVTGVMDGLRPWK